jgi:acyl dehydratase
MTTPPAVQAEGPYFDELECGQVYPDAVPVTLSEGAAAVHQSIVGDRLRLPLDDALSIAATGASQLAHPALVWDVAIGQSTVVTHHVKANLFYRGLVFRRFPHLGDTLTTTTTVEGLRQNRPRPDRAATGLVVDGAAQLARLTLNIARVHHDDRAASGRRLVYGGHTIGIALSQAARAFADLATVLGRHGCDHVGPVHEGDTLRSVITVEAVTPYSPGTSLVHLRSEVFADGDAVGGQRAVLDWRYVALFASAAIRK